MDANPLPFAPRDAKSPARTGFDLFLVSVLVLFFELACMRWFPAHVLFLTFFTNVVLLACFLGMSVGCLAAGRKRNYLAWTPALLAIALCAAHGTNYLRSHLHAAFDAGHQAWPQLVFFGAEAPKGDVARFVIPVEVLNGFFFIVIALAMVGPGQELGRALGRVPNRVLAYTVNIVGSMAGIVLFAAGSWYQLGPVWWFLAVAAGVAYFLVPHAAGRRPLPVFGTAALLLGVVGLAAWTSLPRTQDGAVVREQFWSPYYRIDYEHGTPAEPSRTITVNLIGHQTMNSRTGPTLAYALPHFLNRDAGGPPFRDVLIIGAGSGNDVSRALQWGAAHIDAVEIDPVIYELGRKYHPDRPYDDPRVTVHLDDGRNFLRTTRRTYDLVVYALVDSLVLHSSYSNIRLESYLFTEEAFRDVRRCLKPDGLFAMYNFYRQGWLVGRLHQGLTAAFGSEPLVLPLPYRQEIRPTHALAGEFTVFCAGATDRLRQRFEKTATYWARTDRPPQPTASPNGFEQSPPPGAAEGWVRFGLARVEASSPPLRAATDDWPFLYLRRPLIPDVSVRGMAVMGGLALALLVLFLPRTRGAVRQWGLGGQLFFLGAGFMLIETQAVVRMALLFGSTWMVNSVVFFAVLAMILAANLFVLAVRPERLWPCYVGLFTVLAVNVLVPLDWFLGLDRAVQVTGSCLLVSLPVLFAGVIFAVSFAGSAAPERALGANIAGATLGGLAEYTSMVLGFQHLLLVAIAFYALSAVVRVRWFRGAAQPEAPARQAA